MAGAGVAAGAGLGVPATGFFFFAEAFLASTAHFLISLRSCLVLCFLAFAALHWRFVGVAACAGAASASAARSAKSSMSGRDWDISPWSSAPRAGDSTSVGSGRTLVRHHWRRAQRDRQPPARPADAADARPGSRDRGGLARARAARAAAGRTCGAPLGLPAPAAPTGPPATDRLRVARTPGHRVPDGGDDRARDHPRRRLARRTAGV